MEIIEEKPLMLWEVMEYLLQRKGNKDKWEKTEQRRVFDYANLIVKLEKEKAKELYRALVEKLGIPEIVAVQIVDILPITVMEIEHFVRQIEDIKGITLDHEERDKLINEIQNLTKEYYKYRIKREE